MSLSSISASLVSYGVSGTDCTLFALNLNIHEYHSQVKFRYHFRVTHINLVCWTDICCDKFFSDRAVPSLSPLTSLQDIPHALPYVPQAAGTYDTQRYEVRLLVALGQTDVSQSCSLVHEG
jgi:hypothetical protein